FPMLTLAPFEELLDGAPVPATAAADLKPFREFVSLNQASYASLRESDTPGQLVYVEQSLSMEPQPLTQLAGHLRGKPVEGCVVQSLRWGVVRHGVHRLLWALHCT